MKIVAVNGGPRKKCNTSQMLDSFLSGVRESAPDAEIQTIHLYDYFYTGCKSCFACQLTANRDDLGCRVKDSVTELLKDTFHADGIVFASPVYYLNATAQLRSFWERLMYPGHSPICTNLVLTQGKSRGIIAKTRGGNELWKEL